MSNSKSIAISRCSISCFVIFLEQYFISVGCIFLFIILLSTQVIAANITTSDERVAGRPGLIQKSSAVWQIDIVKSRWGISHNRLGNFKIGKNDEVIINNSIYGDYVDGAGVVAANENLSESAEIILLEVDETNYIELSGKIRILGKPAQIIFVNSNGIVCDQCEFINTSDIELRTDKVSSVDKKIMWIKDPYGDITIGKEGIIVPDGSLTISSGKIKINGVVAVQGILRAESHFIGSSKVKGTESNGEYALDLNTNVPISAERISLIATESGGDIRISVPEFLIDVKGNKSQINTDDGYLYVESKYGNISILKASTELDKDFKFVGKKLTNHGLLKARNIEFELTGSFTNKGEILTQANLSSISKTFANYQKIDVGDGWLIKSDYLVNDDGGYVSAGIIKVYLTGTRDNGYSLYQSSNSILEARKGGMELISREGGMYFGYKKKLTGAGNNKDGFVFVGSQLSSRRGLMKIQSGGDVEFDGVQLVGDVIVEAKGAIKENNITGFYAKGMHNVYGDVNKSRIVMKQQSYTTREVIGHYTECVRRCIFGCCGSQRQEEWGYVVHMANVPAREDYTDQEVVGKEASFKEVSLKTNFIGSKQFFANNINLVFEKEFLYIGTPYLIEYLNFDLTSESNVKKDRVTEYKLHLS